MKKSISIGLMSLFIFFGFSSLNAQNYRNALGLAIDFGDGPTLVGPQYKHSFDGSNALNAQVLFGNHTTAIGFDYSYNQKFAGSGLWWYVGVGPQLAFSDHGYFYDNHYHDGDDTHVAIRPAIGLEYKIPSVPLGFHFDWKPWWNLSHNSYFEAARFSLGFKYILN